jgi:hypothetical protein
MFNCYGLSKNQGDDMEQPEKRTDSLFDKTFRDQEGNIVLAQMPNLPLIMWIATTVLKSVFASGKVYLALDTIAFGALFTWAWLELFDGVNYWRRGLGLAVLVGMVIQRLQ